MKMSFFEFFQILEQGSVQSEKDSIALVLWRVCLRFTGDLAGLRPFGFTGAGGGMVFGELPSSTWEDGFSTKHGCP